MDPKQKDLKKRWKMRERAQARNRFPLSDEELEVMFAAVERRLESARCDRSRRFTEEWLATHGHPKEHVLAWLDEHGGYCDCEVVHNAGGHFRDNRIGAHHGDTLDQ